METLQRLQSIFRDVFDKPALILHRDASSATVEGWDSFNQVALILAIEEEFRIKFELSELDHLKNVGDMVDLLERKTTVS